MSSQLERGKKIASLLLHITMTETEFSPMVVHHPFFESALLSDKNGIFNALEEKERYYDYLCLYEKEVISKCESLLDILAFFRKSYRLAYLKFLREDKIITAAECGSLLGKHWCLIENINHNANVSQAMILKWLKAADKSAFMDKEDLKIYNELSEKITVYRGCGEKGTVKGFSWTTDKDKAFWFATRFSRSGKVFKAVIPKSGVIAYTNQRGEKEVIVDIKQLSDIEELKEERVG